MILLLGSISALNITAGETDSFDLGQQYSYYSIEGNTTEIDLNIYQNGTIVTIVTNKYSQPDNFTIIFYDAKDEEIKRSSGGSSHRRNILDLVYGEPDEEIEKINEEEEIIETSDNNHKITGSVIGNFGVPGIAFIVFLIILIGIFVFVKIKRRNKK